MLVLWLGGYNILSDKTQRRYCIWYSAGIAGKGEYLYETEQNNFSEDILYECIAVAKNAVIKAR